MCGICGFTGNGDQSILETMMEAMAYRGPDAAGSWNDEGGVYLGHRRLSIVDIADDYLGYLHLFLGQLDESRLLQQVFLQRGAGGYRLNHLLPALVLFL